MNRRKRGATIINNKNNIIIRFILAGLLMVSTVLIFNGCGGDSSGAANNNGGQIIPSVEAVQVRFGTLPLTERLTGLVKAKNQVEIYPKISAAITAVYVHDGDVVKRGQALVELRGREFQERLKQAKASYQIAIAQAKQAEAQLKEIQSQLKRMESLYEKGLASSADLETMQTRAVSAEANLELAEARVEQANATVKEREEEFSETIIRAPVAGSVGNRNAEVGMQVSPNARLFILGNLDNMKIEIVLTDRMLNYIKIGQRTEINAQYLSDDILEAPLSRISPFLHPVTHTTIAEIDVENFNGSLKPGMFVTVDVYYGESEQAALIPLAALYENPVTGTTGVYVCRDTMIFEPQSGQSSDKSIALTNPVKFKFIQAEVIARGRMSAGVRGINPDDWVVTTGHNLIGAETGDARVHPVNWGWVEKLQNLQSQDLLQEIMKRQQNMVEDSNSHSL
ncbi:MAG: efflux RND transporter periplasmic adaptor subunit [Calditrichaceae bacterium]|nr:efflux RND transporter periplasmic adaptor subunit [Calditrichaceae bacterium]RQV95458.1 MAG: efflux RND transporter periplasmic adaptor subunit [Calditrichota bacterium]